MQRLETSARKTWLFWQGAVRLRSIARLRIGAKTAGSGVGGARRDRTDDLLLAKQALSQLSYGPVGRRRDRSQKSKIRRSLVLTFDFRLPISLTMVGLGRLELPTSRLSGVRSNRLSYRPDAFAFASCLEERETETAESRSVLGSGPIPKDRSVV